MRTSSEAIDLADPRGSDVDPRRQVLDGKKLSKWFAANEKKLLARAMAIVKNPHTAADIVQEVMLNVWEKRDQYRGDGSIGAWVGAVVHNVALLHLRRQAAHARMRGRLDFDAFNKAIPERLVISAECQLQVSAALDTLGPEKAEVMRRDVIEDEDLQAIADRNGWTLAKVKSMTHRARLKLAKDFPELREYLDDEIDEV